MLYVDTRMSLPDELLLIADKMSMASSVELRVPMLDNDLVALIESARSTQHVRRPQGKSLHKEAMQALLPREIVHRRKLGWQHAGRPLAALRAATAARGGAARRGRAVP